MVSNILMEKKDTEFNTNKSSRSKPAKKKKGTIKKMNQ